MATQRCIKRYSVGLLDSGQGSDQQLCGLRGTRTHNPLITGTNDDLRSTFPGQVGGQRSTIEGWPRRGCLGGSGSMRRKSGLARPRPDEHEE
jgi:hypothetical protein